MDKQKNNRSDDKGQNDPLYKYHRSQMNEDKDNNEAYPDKPKNHTTTDERLIDPDRGEG